MKPLVDYYHLPVQRPFQPFLPFHAYEILTPKKEGEVCCAIFVGCLSFP